MTSVQHRIPGFVAAAALMGALVLNVYWLASIGPPDSTKSQRRSGHSHAGGENPARHPAGKAKQDLLQRNADYRNRVGQWEAAMRIVQSRVVNPELKAQKQAEAQKLAGEIKALEREIDEVNRRRREERLQEQVAGRRKGLVDDIYERVEKKSRPDNDDLEFVRSGVSPSGVRFQLHSRDAVDFSNEVLAELNESGAPRD